MKPILYLALGLLIGILGTASAQEAKRDYDNTADAIQTESCYAPMVQALKDAADPAKRVDQSWNLERAGAYEQLAALGATC